MRAEEAPYFCGLLDYLVGPVTASKAKNPRNTTASRAKGVELALATLAHIRSERFNAYCLVSTISLMGTTTKKGGLKVLEDAVIYRVRAVWSVSTPNVASGILLLLLSEELIT